MIHGIQKLEITNASVHEALQEWLQKHVATGIEVEIKTWEIAPQGSVAYGETPKPSIKIEFQQVTKQEGIS
jgi:hypothetical protein